MQISGVLEAASPMQPARNGNFYRSLKIRQANSKLTAVQIFQDHPSFLDLVNNFNDYDQKQVTISNVRQSEAGYLSLGRYSNISVNQ